MTKIRLVLLVFACLVLTGCKTEEHVFPLEKRYWSPADYEEVIRELRFGYDAGEKLPTLNDPETGVIVKRLTDEENYKVVLEDEELGLNHRNEVATEFFKQLKNMSGIYNATDRKDQYLYEEEMLAVWHFGLGLQLRYFKLGNERILANADDPNSSKVKNYIASNRGALINNYLLYLNKINTESAFTEKGKEKLARGIDVYFTELIESYPDADFNAMEKKIELMMDKSESNEIKSSLQRIQQLIDSKNSQEQNS